MALDSRPFGCPVTTPTLNLRGGALDLAVTAGRDAAFLIPTPSDLTGYTWAGAVKSDYTTDATEYGTFAFTVTSGGATVRLSRTVTTLLPVRAVYEIVVTALDGTITSLLSGSVSCDPGVA